MYAEPDDAEHILHAVGDQRFDERLGRRHLLLAGDGRRQLHGLVHCVLLGTRCDIRDVQFFIAAVRLQARPEQHCQAPRRTSTFAGRETADDAKTARRRRRTTGAGSTRRTGTRQSREDSMNRHWLVDPRGRVGRRASAVRNTAFAQTAAAPVRMRIQTAVPSASIYFELLKRMGDRIDRMSAGRVKMEIPARRRGRARVRDPRRGRQGNRRRRLRLDALLVGQESDRRACSPIRWRARAWVSTSCRTSRGSSRAAATTSIASSTRTCSRSTSSRSSSSRWARIRSAGSRRRSAARPISRR